MFIFNVIHDMPCSIFSTENNLIMRRIVSPFRRIES